MKCQEDCDYSYTVDRISSMFGDLIQKDVITTIVESYGGDISLAVDAIMKITSDSSNVTDKQDNQLNTNNLTHGTYETISLNKSNISGELNKVIPSTSKQAIKNVSIPKKPIFWTDTFHKIVENHKNFARTMIIMRGVPGSGKSSLAKEIVNWTVGISCSSYTSHIFSADDYFMVKDKYIFNKFQLSEAHLWNQNRVKTASREGLSPIIVDNTNIDLWEMEPYVRDGVNHGYIIEVLEPNTPWARNPSELAKRNIHCVPKVTISRMLEKYCQNVTSQQLMHTFGLSYPLDKIPPVLRKVNDFISKLPSASSEIKPETVEPNLIQKECFVDSSLKNKKSEDVSSNCHEDSVTNHQPGCSKEQQPTVQEADKDNITSSSPASLEISIVSDLVELETNDEKNIKDKLLLEAEMKLQELQKEEHEWDSNDSWTLDASKNESTSKNKDTASVSQPKRSRRKIVHEPVLSEEWKNSINKCENWRDIPKLMPSWTDEQNTVQNILDYKDAPEMVCSSTCMEMGDTDISKGNLKIICATPRNINSFYIPFNKEKVSDKIMLDKSSMTNENISIQPYRCQNEEKHFSSFKKLFPKVAKADLRDIFDKCNGDVNWAVDIVIDGVDNKLLRTLDDEDISDTEDSDSHQCDCLAAYNIIPDRHITDTLKLNHDDRDPTNIPGCSKDIVPQAKKKIKKEISDSSMLLKTQMEKNFIISDDYYSEHCLKIKKMRHGEVIRDEDVSELSCSSDNQYNTCLTPESNDNIKTDQSDDDFSVISMDDVEKVVPVNLGMDFVKVLDNLFGRNDMIYPPNIKAKFSLRSSLLNELNAVWMESLMHQLEDEALNATKKDEEFARELANKEAELLQSGKEQAVPDLKEIMDMEYALNLYQKNVDEWKKQQPNDYAAKLTREKLCNLFPDVSPETLMELLMAHENNFEATVEVLLNSMGKTDILNSHNGVKKFIMQQEMQRQEKALEKERKALSEVDWPLLTKGDPVDMNVVYEYREEADRHLLRRNENFNKAQDYIRRGMIQVAAFYSEVASFHRQKYEQASSKAAISLLQINAAKNPDAATIDLHYLHVCEAMESLDIFVDTHIQKLKELQAAGQPISNNTLFIITGRGLHSPGGPKIKPAVKRRLKERGMPSGERNPGLLTTTITVDNLMSHQIRKG